MYRNEATARARVPEFTRLGSDPSAMLNSCRTNMKAALEAARRHVPQILVVKPPRWKQEVFTAEQEAVLWHGRIGNSCEGGSRFLSTSDLYRLFELVGTTVTEVAAEGKFELLDPQDRLDQVIQAFYDHVHLTEVGARALAEAIATRILRHTSQLP
jgi:hypothetical protein